MYKYLINRIREYIFIILTATIFLQISFSKSYSEENVFTIDDIKIKGVVDLNFSRDKYINKAFLDSFETLKSRILLTKDFNKIQNIKLKKIKNLISGFQIVEEVYKKNEYTATFRIFYNDIKVKEFLGEKNLSFSQPEKISAIFFPALFINDEMKDFNDNYFYKNWTDTKIINETINFILPLEDLDDVSKIEKMKDKIEDLDASTLVNKYDVKNYVFALMDYDNNNLNVHLKTNFNQNMISKNISYSLKSIKNEKELNLILKNLKMEITDIWKEINVVNISMPLTIRIKFKHTNVQNLDELKNTFNKISIVNNFILEEFNINKSFFKIQYYGNPKKLKTELSKFGYQLKNDQGHWELYIDG